MQTYNSPPKQSSQNGFTLIEILISVFVLAVGLLGMGGLQITSMKSTNNAHFVTTASFLARDLGERMSANPNAVSLGLYEGETACGSRKKLCRHWGSSCTSTELSIYDRQEVMCGVRRGSGSNMRREGGAINLLPNSDIEVTCIKNCAMPRPNNAEFSIDISWRALGIDSEQEENTQDEKSSFAMVINP